MEYKLVIRGPGGKRWEHGSNRLLQVSTREARHRTKRFRISEIMGLKRLKMAVRSRKNAVFNQNKAVSSLKIADFAFEQRA